MARKPSESSKFKSRYANETYISPAQYIAELMCERMAARKNEELPYQFWNSPKWKRPFLLQLRFANGLLKVYDAKVILKALKSKEGKNIYSLGAKWLDPIIKAVQTEVDKTPPIEYNIEKVQEEPILPEQRPAFVPKKSTLGKLRDMDV